MGLALPSMARSAPPELDVELCVADAPAIETLCAEGGSCGSDCEMPAHGQKRRMKELEVELAKDDGESW